MAVLNLPSNAGMSFFVLYWSAPEKGSISTWKVKLYQKKKKTSVITITCSYYDQAQVSISRHQSNQDMWGTKSIISRKPVPIENGNQRNRLSQPQYMRIVVLHLMMSKGIRTGNLHDNLEYHSGGYHGIWDELHGD